MEYASKSYKKELPGVTRALEETTKLRPGAVLELDMLEDRERDRWREAVPGHVALVYVGRSEDREVGTLLGVKDAGPNAPQVSAEAVSSRIVDGLEGGLDIARIGARRRGVQEDGPGPDTESDPLVRWEERAVADLEDKGGIGAVGEEDGDAERGEGIEDGRAHGRIARGLEDKVGSRIGLDGLGHVR